MSASGSIEANPPLRTIASFGSAHANVATASAIAIAEAPDESTLSKPLQQDVSIESLRSALVGVLEAQGQDTAAGLLAGGEWKLEGNQISLRLALSEKVIDLSLSADARRLLTQEAGRLCGRAMKLSVSGGATSQNIPVERTSNGNGYGAGGARQRAAEDPIVNRMQQKFGAEVRTVVDLRQKK
jgi:DNA polymerase-3 subunit gamma/tau